MSATKITRFQAEDFEIAESKVDRILSAGQSTEQIIETGLFFKDGEEFEITSDHLESFVKNFNDRVIGTDPPINFGHERTGEAAGWIKGLFLDASKTKLFADIKWSASGLSALVGKTWRYVSAEFTNAFFDGSTRKTYGPTLAGAALTNVPFLRHMPALVGLSNEGTAIELKQTKSNEGDLKMDDKVISLADHNAAMKHLNARLQTLEDEIASNKVLLSDAVKVKADRDKLATELKDIVSKFRTKERESDFAKLLSEGKACEAQRAAFMEEKMDEFIKLAQPINLEGKGKSGDGDTKVTKFDDLPEADRRVFHQYLEGSGMTKEAYLASLSKPTRVVSGSLDS